jgi:hypothetical protein
MIGFEKHKQVHELIQSKNTIELLKIKEQSMNMLRSEKILRQFNRADTLPHNEIEMIIEVVVKIEAYESGLNWFARTKRRLSLTKEYAL